MTTKCYFDDPNFKIINDNNEFIISDDRENPGYVKLTIVNKTPLKVNDQDDFLSEVIVNGSDLVLAIQKCLLIMNDASA